MDLYLDPSWVMWKDVVLEGIWVLAELSAPLEVVKPVPPSEMVLVCWGYSEVEYFHSESVVAVMARVKFVGVVEMCFCARCGQYD